MLVYYILADYISMRYPERPSVLERIYVLFTIAPIGTV